MTFLDYTSASLNVVLYLNTMLLSRNIIYISHFKKSNLPARDKRENYMRVTVSLNKDSYLPRLRWPTPYKLKNTRSTRSSTLGDAAAVGASSYVGLAMVQKRINGYPDLKSMIAKPSTFG